MLPLEGDRMAFPVPSSSQQCWGVAGPSQGSHHPPGPRSGVSGAASGGALQTLTALCRWLCWWLQRAGKQQRNDSRAASAGEGVCRFRVETSLCSTPPSLPWGTGCHHRAHPRTSAALGDPRLAEARCF